MSDAEVMTTGLVATVFSVPILKPIVTLFKLTTIFQTLFEILGEGTVQLYKHKRYAINTIPVVVWAHVRISR